MSRMLGQLEKRRETGPTDGPNLQSPRFATALCPTAVHGLLLLQILLVVVAPMVTSAKGPGQGSPFDDARVDIAARTISTITEKMCSNVVESHETELLECRGETYTFSTRDPAAYSYLKISGVEDDLFVAWEWYGPSGKRYKRLTATVPEPTGASDTVVAKSFIGIEGSTPETMPGEWTVRVSIGRDIQFEYGFTINKPPAAVISYSPTNPNPNSTVTFDALESSDEEGDIVSYLWDFNSDGTVDTTGTTAEYKFDQPGEATVKLTVVDNYGLNTTASTTVSVNAPPDGFVRLEPRFPSADADVTLVAANVSDGDGSVVAYKWDWNTDGSFEATGRRIHRRFEQVGAYNVSLVLVDDDNATTVVRRTISVYHDSDGDGLVDPREKSLGTDLSSTDTDDDGLSDGREVQEFGTDPKVPDSDGDGLLDQVELDETGTDPRNPDHDGDGLLDGEEVGQYDSDPVSADSDSDTLEDGVEVHEYGSDPTTRDTDGDGLSDGREVTELRSNPTETDSDEDGVPDRSEFYRYGTDLSDTDSDGDGLSDGQEVNEIGSLPNASDTDSDSLSDGREVTEIGSDPTSEHSDGDGIDDSREVEDAGSDPTVVDTDNDGLDDDVEISDPAADPADHDTDDDGLSDGRERSKLATLLGVADTDGDGLSDGREVLELPTNATVSDSDGDGVVDGVEVRRGMNPVLADTDVDFVQDGTDPAPANWALPLGVGYSVVSFAVWGWLFLHRP